MSQEILSKFAQLQTENRNQKQELKRYSQMLPESDENKKEGELQGEEFDSCTI